MPTEETTSSPNEIVKPLVTMPVEARNIRNETLSVQGEGLSLNVPHLPSLSIFHFDVVKKIGTAKAVIFFLVLIATLLYWVVNGVGAEGIVVPRGNELITEPGVPPRLKMPVRPL